MATWPSGVPYAPHKDSLRVKPSRDPLRTEMEDGPARLRPSSTLNVGTLNFQILMSSTELSTFASWFKTTIVQGTAAFTMSVWIAGSFTNKTCRFVSPYQITGSSDGMHQVQVEIEVDDY